MPDCFSMCLGLNGGIFVLGGDNSQYYTGGYTYTPIINETYYVVQMNDFKVGGKSLGIPASDYGQTIVDSGTTLLIVPERAYNLIKSIILNLCSKVKLAGVCGIPQNETIFFGFCYPMTSTQLSQFPDFTVELDGFSGVLGPQDYLFPSNNTYCYGIDGGDPADGTILGDIFIQSQYVLFDRANKRVGFATPNCGGPTPVTTASTATSSHTSSTQTTQTSQTSTHTTSTASTSAGLNYTSRRSGRTTATGLAAGLRNIGGGKHKKPKFISNNINNKLKTLKLKSRKL